MHTSGKRLHDGEVVRRTLQLQRVIHTFQSDWFSLTMVIKQTGLPKGTIHRYLTIFVEEGILERHLHLHTYRQVDDK